MAATQSGPIPRDLADNEPVCLIESRIDALPDAFRIVFVQRAALAREFDAAIESAFSFDGARCDRIVANVLLRLKNMIDKPGKPQLLSIIRRISCVFPRYGQNRSTKRGE